VRLSGDDLEPQFKHFERRENALAFAKAQVPDNADRAEIRLVKFLEVRTAVDAAKRGDSELIEVVDIKPTEADLDRARERKWEEIESRGPQAVQEYLLEELMRLESKMPTGPKGQKRPADVISNAVHVMKVLTGEADDGTTDDGKDPAAKALGAKGGAARAKSMTPERRSEIAKKAAGKRWTKAD